MANVTGERIRGNLVYRNGRGSIIDAVGPDVFKYFEDFIGPVAASDALVGWTITLVEAGAGESTVTIPDGLGGVLLLTTDANEDDGVSLQKSVEQFKLSTACHLAYFGIRVKISDATQSDLFVGLSVLDTTPLGGVTDGVYFQKDDAAATIKATTEKNSTETNTAAVATLVADTYVVLEFVYTPTVVKFYVNGTLVATHTTNICDDEELTPTIQFLAGAAAVKTASVDWIRAIQIGR